MQIKRPRLPLNPTHPRNTSSDAIRRKQPSERFHDHVSYTHPFNSFASFEKEQEHSL
ncbi:hypothetical protein Pla52o_27320 [Novipirellula galeiformis]|uniref:Uncharacterized protein n=1 Tax=Novipirellula galeiformis TaxID=2528004 RepID=A0A5C6CHH8_9BACT|nr:hypothetical protein Pla52o_27320 [Novipirellula galeiformis]